MSTSTHLNVENTHPSDAKLQEDGDGDTHPSSSTTSVPSSDTLSSSTMAINDAKLDQMMKMMESMNANIERFKAEQAQMKGEQAQMKVEQAKLKRRHSHGILSTPQPLSQISVLTDPSFAKFHTPSATTAAAAAAASTRFSVGGRPSMVREVAFDEEEDEEAEEDSREHNLTSKREESSSEWEKRKAKVMSKISPPPKFSGNTEAEKDMVEHWVNTATNYLNGVFGSLSDECPQERMQFIMNLLNEPASTYVTAMCTSQPNITWEEMRQGFIDHIRGGREARALWKQKMQSLTLGKGKCKDLLALDSEFERLRLKLYPTSSLDVAMNERLGDDYKHAIRRGHPELYREMLRIIALSGDAPTLMDWKAAATRAHEIIQARQEDTRGAHTVHQQGGGGGQQQRGGWNHKPWHRSGSSSVNEMNSTRGDGDESEQGVSEEGQAEGASAQQMQGRRPPYPPRPRLLTDDEHRRVVELRLCFQCYKKGHRIGDPACKEAGKPKRKPTAEELKG